MCSNALCRNMAFARTRSHVVIVCCTQCHFDANINVIMCWSLGAVPTVNGHYNWPGFRKELCTDRKQIKSKRGSDAYRCERPSQELNQIN